MPKTKNLKTSWVKNVKLNHPDTNFFLPKDDKKLISELLKPHVFKTDCQKTCTKVIDLLPSTLVEANTGVGYHMINVDGFRYLNAYVISDPLNSTSKRGFTLEISFSVNDFVYGVGVVGETSHFFNFDNYYNSSENDKKLVHIGTSDLTSLGGLTQIGGVDYTHLLRIPVMGPFIRASVFNKDNTDREVTVKAYLTT
ncbi:hypothetical protein D3C71_393930 [compost metagenome]